MEQLRIHANKEQDERKQALLKQLRCLRYLLRQGLAVRGPGHKDIEGNLQQLLIMWSSYNSNLE